MPTNYTNYDIIHIIRHSPHQEIRKNKVKFDPFTTQHGRQDFDDFNIIRRMRVPYPTLHSLVTSMAPSINYDDNFDVSH